MIVLDQVSLTEETMRKTKQFLDYVASYPDAIFTFSASSMVLAMHSDTSYLTEPQAITGGHFLMFDNAEDQENN